MTGVLLVNLGTPDSPHPSDVRRYLREFLSDPRVLDIPSVPRKLLLETAILPFRPRASGAAYAKVWQPEGSPLLVHGRALRDALADELGPAFVVALGMRYGKPSIASALEQLAGCDVIRVLPLFPQYSAAATASAVAKVLEVAAARWDQTALQISPPFFDDPAFTRAVAEVAAPVVERAAPNHVLFSYHGLPERQIRKSDPTEGHCLSKDSCCEPHSPALSRCYRAQCFATTRAVAGHLGLGEEEYTVSFQSRLGRTPWIQPFTDEVLPQLAERGVSRLAVLCPSFVADCLETIEEIGIRGREQWRALGGEELTLIPCVNAHPTWVSGVASLVR